MALRRAFTQAILRRSQQTSSSSSSSTSALSALYSSPSSQNRMISTSSRSNYAGGESTQTSVEKFQELFDKYRPSMMDPPGTPSTYMPAEDVAKSGEEEVKNAGPPPETVKLNFRLPHEAVFADAEVNMVLVPAETGDFGILPGHVPVVAKLRPGVVSVENKESVTSRYFVSSGFAFAHADSSVDILAVEAVPVEHLDETVVRKMLSEHTAKFQAAKDDYEKATHQIGIDVSTAMVSAIETMGK